MYKGQCRVADCGKPIHGRGLCGAHYRRWRLYGSEYGGKQVNRQPAKCVVPQCGRKPSAHDLCAAHVLRWYRTGGDPLQGISIRHRRTKRELPR